MWISLIRGLWRAIADAWHARQNRIANRKTIEAFIAEAKRTDAK